MGDASSVACVTLINMSHTGTHDRPRWVGIDYGKKRVGIAIADPLRLFAQPLGTFPPREALSKLKELDRAEGIERAIVGWPLMPDGDEGTATREVGKFIERIRKALPSVQVVRWDERYTSVLAVEKIREAGPNRRWGRNKGRIDAAAAAILLQEFLDDVGSRDADSA